MLRKANWRVRMGDTSRRKKHRTYTEEMTWMISAELSGALDIASGEPVNSEGEVRTDSRSICPGDIYLALSRFGAPERRQCGRGRGSVRESRRAL